MSAIIEAINQAGQSWWPYVFHVTWTSSLVAVLLLLLVRLGRRWPAKLRYGIILIALIKFAVPPTLAMPIGLFSWFGPAVVQDAKPITIDDEQITAEWESSVWSGLVGTWARLSWQSRLMLFHILGSTAAALCVLSQLARVARMVRRARTVSEGPVYGLFLHLCRDLGLRRPVQLLALSEPVTPIAFGLWRPRVLVPVSVLRELPADQARAILAHELAHHRRADLWINSVQILLGIAWWFNPLVRLLNRVLRRIREDCCDDLLLCRDMTTESTYCQALLTIASDLGRVAQLTAALGFAQALHPLGIRIQRIMDPKLRRLSKLSWGALISTVVLAVLLLPGLSSQPAAVHSSTSMELALDRGTTAHRYLEATSDDSENNDAVALESRNDSELVADNVSQVNLQFTAQPKTYLSSINSYPASLNTSHQGRATAGSNVSASTPEGLAWNIPGQGSPRGPGVFSGPAPGPYTVLLDTHEFLEFGTISFLVTQRSLLFESVPDEDSSSSGDQDTQKDDPFAEDAPGENPEPLRSPGGGGGSPRTPEQNNIRSPIFANDYPSQRSQPLSSPTPVPGTDNGSLQRLAQAGEVDNIYRKHLVASLDFGENPFEGIFSNGSMAAVGSGLYQTSPSVYDFVATPEPTAIWTMAIAGLMLVRRRRRPT